jgi:hypothetical protein
MFNLKTGKGKVQTVGAISIQHSAIPSVATHSESKEIGQRGKGFGDGLKKWRIFDEILSVAKFM